MVNIQGALLGSNYSIIQLNIITVNPPIPPIYIGKTEKEVMYITKKTHIRDPNQRRYWESGGIGGLKYEIIKLNESKRGSVIYCIRSVIYCK